MELRIIDHNYVQADETALSASSSNPSFPVSNLAHPSRSRVHRSSLYGNYVITATNNKVDFEEAEGVELTGTITPGTYTGATLATAIADALETAGAEDYTVQRSLSTGKWTFISDTGAHFSLLWDTGTNAAESIGAVLGFDIDADDTGATSYAGAQIAIHTEEWVLVDIGTSEAVDSVAILFNLMTGHKFSPTAVLRIQANPTDLWSAPAVDQVLTIDEDYNVASHFFGASQTYRYWRLKIVDTANPYLYVETPKLVLGLGVQLSALPGRGFNFKRVDQSTVQETRYGHRYSDRYPLRNSLSFNYPGLSLVDVEKLETAFIRNGKTTPVLIAVDPTEEAFDKDQFLIYGYFNGDLELAHLTGTKFSVPIGITEAV